MKRREVILVVGMAAALGVVAEGHAIQPAGAAPEKPKPVTWSIALAPDARAVAGGVVKAKITATIARDWHVYSMTQAPDGPSPLLIDVPGASYFSLAGAVVESKPVTQFDLNFGLETSFFEKTATLTVPIRIAPGAPAGPHRLRVALDYQACSNRLCLPPATVEVKADVVVDAGIQK